MHIEQVEIMDFRVFKNTKIDFKGPTDNSNIINIIAGVNGSGKTSLLEALYQYPISPDNQEALIVRFSEVENTLAGLPESRGLWSATCRFFQECLDRNKNQVGPFSDPRLIYIPALLNFTYESVSNINTSYAVATRIDHQLLGRAEFYIKEYILGLERKSDIANPDQRTKAAVDKFNEHFGNTRLLTRLHELDSRRFNRPVFKNARDDLVTIDQLSDGEQQLYGRVVALMILEPRNSIILIDEPEISLHPAWQQEIMKIYASIGFNNQFIVATHSPQIIGNTPYENLVMLMRKESGIVPVCFDHPPAGIDVNSILTEIMGVPARPPEMDKLYRRYRELVEQGKEKNEEGKDIWNKITALEVGSEFMHEVNFMIQLRDDA